MKKFRRFWWLGLLLALAACSPYAKLPLPAPALLAHSPAAGETQPLEGEVALTFDQPMDRKSVEAAFAIEPQVKGALDWRDDRTLTFKPVSALSRGTVYSVTVKGSAKNASGTQLADPVFFDFSTVGYLSITEVQPVSGSSEISLQSAVMVVFDRPVVGLTAIEKQDDLPDPLSFDPPVAGTGEWLNTFIYRFEPATCLNPATTYTARVAGGLQDTLGTVMDQPYTWTFTTMRPVVHGIWPQPSTRHVAPQAVVRITFNQPMDHASVESAFSLRIGDEPVPGVFGWSGGDYVTQTETMVFTPSIPFARNLLATAELTSTDTLFPYARDRRDDPAGRLLQGVRSDFYTILDAGLVSSRVLERSQNVDDAGGVAFVFASPMDSKVFPDYISIDPPVPDAGYSWRDQNTSLSIQFNRMPGATYTVRLKPGAPDRYGMVVAAGAELSFTTGDRPAYVLWNTDSQLGLYDAYSETVLFAGYRNVSQLNVSLYRFAPELWMWWQAYANYDQKEAYRPAEADLVRAWTIPIDALRNKSYLAPVTMTGPDGAALPPGVYFVEIDAPEAARETYSYYYSRRYVFIRTRLNLTLKQTHSEALAWATDLATGAPVAGVPLGFYTHYDRAHYTGTTDRDGLVVARNLHLTDLYDPYFVVAGEPGADNFAVAYNNWDSGIQPWNFGMAADYRLHGYYGYLYTDRPLYRPGQPVYFKGILRADDDAFYSVPGAVKSRQVIVTDPQGKTVFNGDFQLNDWGTFNGEFQLDENAALGTYALYMDEASVTFRVLEYSKPEYQVEVIADRDDYINGETMSAAIDASYYFGGPVAGAGVQWNVLSAGFDFVYDCPASAGACPRYSWNDYAAYRYDESYGGRDRRIASGMTKTDSEGQAVFQTPADISEEINSRQFILEATVTDINGQAVSSRAVAVVHKGAYYIGVAPRNRVAKANTETTVDILTVDWDSAPVSGNSLEVTFLEHRWYSVRRQDDDGGFYWTWTVEDVPIYTTTVTTGANGKATTVVTPPKSGSYRISVRGSDQYGNEIRSASYLWVWGGGRAFWRQESNYRIELIADKDEYSVGDVAEVLIPSPYEASAAAPVYALVTIERGHILETRVVALQSNSELVRVPIVEAHIPNIFVSVVLMQGGGRDSEALASFKMGLIKLPVEVSRKQLNIAITSDQLMTEGGYYRPRETAKFDVMVTDSLSRPVQTELSLRLADLAVLALADDPGPTLLQRFWSERGLQVRTSVPLVIAMEKYTRDLIPGAKGGGSGGEGGFVRTNFKDTAYWEPDIRTGADGRAHVEVTLPDNLTTWRMQARGVTPDMRVGVGELDILSTLDLLVRAVIPRFLVIGDRVEIATIVHNNTPEARRVQVTLTAPGLKLDGNSQQTVEVPAGGKTKVIWPVAVEAVSDPAAGDLVRIKMEARSGDYYDGREDKLPVYRPTTPEVVATSGQLSEAGIRQELIYLPEKYDSTQGELLLKLNGSLTAGLQDSLDYLEHYPYECIEQTVSRFLPNVMTYQALAEMKAASPELRQALAERVGVALQRLYSAQRYDGGWGWWPGAVRSDPYITSYALQGLLEARRAGFTVEESVIHKAATYLRPALPSTESVKYHWEANRMAYQLYVLAEYKVMFNAGSDYNVLSWGISLFDNRRLLDRYGQATLAMALALLDKPDNTRTQTLLINLAGESVMSATGAHWEESRYDYWNMNTDVRTTAIVVWALSRLRPTEPLLPNAVRWLMETRQLDSTASGFRPYWESTNTTAWALLALTEYMRASGEMEGDFNYQVYLNNKRLDEGVVSAGTLTETNEIEVAVAKLLADEANRLIIERQEPGENQTGKGQLYYTAYLRYFLPTEQIPALDRGISIARRYEPVTVHPNAAPGEGWVGDVIRVNLTIVAQDNLYYVVLEDPFPAGCEAVDVSLKTTSMMAEGVEMRRESLNRWGYGSWWFEHTELRDEKLAMFASYLPRGTYQLSYYIRASVPGVFNVLPATAYEMYFPEVFGRSDGMMFTVKSEEALQVVTFPTPTPRPTPTPLPPTPTSTPGPTPTPLPFLPVLVDGVPAQAIRHLWTSPSGQLWLATEKGILVYNDGSWVTLSATPAERILGTDAAGRVWVILEGGAAIAVYDGATWTSYGAAQGWQPPAPAPLDAQGREITTPRFGVWGDVVADAQGGVWLAAGRDELRHLSPQTGLWETLTAADLGFAPVGNRAIPGHMLTDAAVDSFGNVWVGDCIAYNETLRGQGARWFNGETWSGSRDTVEECVYDIEVDGAGAVWLGGRFALTRYDPAAQAFIQIPLPQWNTYQVVSDLNLDGQGGLWVELWRTSGGSYGQRALFHLSSDGLWNTVYQSTPSLRASSPALQADGSAWFCSTSLVSRVRSGATADVPYLPDGETPPEEGACQIAVDGADRVWWTDGARLWTVNE